MRVSATITKTQKQEFTHAAAFAAVAGLCFEAAFWDKHMQLMVFPLFAVLEEDMPGRLLNTFRRMPSAGKSANRRGARAAARRLQGLHPQAEDLLRRIAN